MPEYTDPANTLALLDKLEPLGLSDKAFSIIHHFVEPEKIANHRRYCEMLCEEAAHFRTPTNQRVQQRLGIIARMYEAGMFTVRSSALFERLAEAALLEVPHDPRPLAEQVSAAEQKATS
jgi:hypothetical protein